MSNSKVQSRIRNKTVYLLGAGFSTGCGIPVLSRFIPAGLALLKDSDADQDFISKMESTLNEYLPAAEFLPDRLVNLEDLFCLVDLRKQHSPRLDSAEGSATPVDHENTLKRFVVEVLTRAWSDHENKWEAIKKNSGKRGKTIADQFANTDDPPVVARRSYFQSQKTTVRPPETDQHYNTCAYQAFLSQVLFTNDTKRKKRESLPEEEADAIVTLNYDLVIERKLRKISDTPVYYGAIHSDTEKSHDAESTEDMPRIISNWRNEAVVPLPLFKIHGSINWQAPIPDTRTGTSTALGVSSFWNPDKDSAKEEQRIAAIPIIPPTWRKSAASNTIFSRLLGKALQHMRLAERIVIVGYSLPSTDAYFRYLLAEALGTPLLPSIELWDIIPPCELESRILRALGDRIQRVAKACSLHRQGFLELVASKHNDNAVYL